MAHPGLRPTTTNDRAADSGVGDVVFSIETPVDGNPATAGNGVHIAFAAQDQEMVDEFYRLALCNGGFDAGAPGVRSQYDAHLLRCVRP